MYNCEQQVQHKLMSFLDNDRYYKNRVYYSLDTDELKMIFSKCSKNGTEKYGRPDGIFLDEKNEVIVIFEAKKTDLNKACDEVKHYMRKMVLNKRYTKIFGIALIGTEIHEYKIFLFSEKKIMNINSDMKYSSLLNSIGIKEKIPKKALNTSSSLMETTIHKFHNLIREKLNLSDSDKPLLISLMLLCLSDPNFKNTYLTYKDPQLLTSLSLSILDKCVKENMDILDEKHNMDDYLKSYLFVKNHEGIKKENVFRDLLSFIETKVFGECFSSDLMNKFYSEFVKYHSIDSKSLGIVLTPPEYVKLMIKFLNIIPQDSFLDLCTGSGSFMLEASKYNPKFIVGCEYQDRLFHMVFSNFVLRNKKNVKLYKRDCFEVDFPLCDKSCINPPYSNTDLELSFVMKQLSSLNENGVCCCILPSSKISPNEYTKEILSKHKLLCVINTTRDSIFYGIGVQCSIIFIQKKFQKNYKTLFINLEDDGMVRVKCQGRKDVNNIFNSKMNKYYEIYNEFLRNENIEVKDENVKIQQIDKNTEWNYHSILTKNIDVKKISIKELNKNYESLKCLTSEKDEDKYIIPQKEQEFNILELFLIHKGNHEVQGCSKIKDEKNNTFLISAKNNNNGVAGYVPEDQNTFYNKKMFSLGKQGNAGSGLSFYLPFSRVCGASTIYLLEPKNNEQVGWNSDKITEKSGIYIARKISENHSKFSFGRGLNTERLKEVVVSLPVINNKIDFETMNNW